ncbi:hypothetical protein [Phyllobacterium sp. YR531]|uniref:hypothetical protein n=1 Tax=Phyllobacterium sp. YR531 TaxID=1144343 RepID=UPI00026FBA90|nr:hypothetical protein [Phyllobacterium sp. YR531]EJN05866.1 hypothetical protein PMI41_00657 [Phyllobacterium sp. YR531]
MPVTIRIAVRDWDYLTPLILGDITSEKLTVQVDRVDTLVGELATDPVYDAKELSFSRYASQREAGDQSVFGIPNFLMRSFRHRCIITRSDSSLEQLAELAGKRIGVTGWRDSGNTWTRAALRRGGVGIDDALWIAGRLTAEHPIVDRLDGFGRPGLIESAPEERPLIELLDVGEIDAVFTPFMPNGYFEAGSRFRQLQRDFRSAELDYFRAVGYVPGIHLVGVKSGLAERYPWLPGELSAMIDASQKMWTQKRRKYADTTPWIIDELLNNARDLPESWCESGFLANRTMIADFSRELHEQRILGRQLTPEELFPAYAAEYGSAA